MTRELVPVTVIGGYLGAGKTTIVNRLLAGDHGLRLAVLVNDFGEVNIDEDRIAFHDGQTIGLTNGCVCCSISDALGEGLDMVLAGESAPQHIIIEASGVADPAKIAIYGQGWPGCRLESVLVVADVETVQDRATDRFVGRLIRRQISAADRIALSRCDLASEKFVANAAVWISELTSAPVIAMHPVTSIEQVVFSSAVGSVQRRSVGALEGLPADEASTMFEHATVRFPKVVARSALEAALSSLPDSVVRVKGKVWVRSGPAADPRLVAVDRAGMRWVIEESASGGGIHQASSLVVVALAGAMDVAALTASFDCEGSGPDSPPTAARYR